MMEAYLTLLTWIPAHPILALILLVVEFLVLMKLYHHFNDNKILRILFGIFFLPQDIVGNATVISLIGFELPQEYTATSRMKRWKKLNPHSNNWIYRWRFRFANTLCNILNWADKEHC